ncbi:hypothetical protein [Mucilaginibacter arboris]|uniref:Uncharacterized protein n=1 Tax=Mucilaginibacter arboris TaxID=2682090 RepID=A0A7K1T0Z9_9SPHI|nr:hypothetical protein [Mucilaginibacter arboris]MVN23236.1 hypothetical protein [Mucilaginibacter arboris]
MEKQSPKTSDETKLSFADFKSYSVEEIMAAGGTTAFANKSGKHPQQLVEALKNLPADAFLTEEELELALKMLKDNK